MTKYIIEQTNKGWEQHEVEADTPYEAVEKALGQLNMVNAMEPVKPSVYEFARGGKSAENYVGWLELKIRVSPAQEEDDD
jgi:hypothetical protein